MYKGGVGWGGVEIDSKISDRKKVEVHNLFLDLLA